MSRRTWIVNYLLRHAVLQIPRFPPMLESMKHGTDYSSETEKGERQGVSAGFDKASRL